MKRSNSRILDNTELEQYVSPARMIANCQFLSQKMELVKRLYLIPLHGEVTLNEELRDSMEDKKKQNDFDIRGKIREVMAASLDAKLLEILREVKYEDISSASFDIEKCDVKVNGTAKSTQGKGFRAFLNTVVAVAVQEFLNENAVHKVGMLAIDSPILSLVEKQDPDDKQASDVMRRGLFEYLVKHTTGGQMIVVENNIPSIDYGSTNVIEFTRTSEGRYGLVESYRK